ncbi:MAG: hypothetical protein UT24_C0007G0020 [Candidatus Woesebacteria bacterium GW2011_GWB1_39_12]|uniref:DUF305 domain-containing protein n=3 Tax=Candidatus Woeseibacteriota TaxID=1752722 RepID=A0A0G0MCX6_9BACT|nr:MAG: hypothetical protein UT24_C0007G0020 [Candidatus Woesebacteria bacterium GW2011_GWB1_39_12]
MDKTLTYAIIGGLVGVVATLLITNYSVNNRNYGMMRMMGMGGGIETMMQGEKCPMMKEGEKNENMGMSINEMTGSLIGVRGEEFEKAFIETMIAHHQGAIDMAKLIPSRTDKPELNKLGEDIISAQSKEIEMMEGWMEDWF